MRGDLAGAVIGDRNGAVGSWKNEKEKGKP